MTDCDHYETEFILTPELTHHGKFICKTCGKFLGWAKKPETITRENVNAATVDRLKHVSLTEWEKGFILSIEKQGMRLSPKQQDVLDKIAEKFPRQ